jgi:hypothetical protein
LAATPPAAPTDPTQTATASASAGTASGVGSVPQTYESPVVKIDPATGAAVLSFLNPGTNQQAFQVPSRTALEYERQQRLAMPAEKATVTTATE